MKLSNFSLTFITRLSGDTGNNNKSVLTFLTNRGGKVLMPKFSWERSDFPVNLDEIKKIELRIPSGLLTVYNSTFGLKIDVYEDSMITFSGDYCEWDGNVAGLIGGMSGYGSHKLDPDNKGNKGNVWEGTYLVPPGRDFVGWGTHVVDLDRYQQRIFTASTVREDRILYDQARIAGNVSDQEWFEYIKSLDRAYIEGVSADAVPHILAYTLKDVTDLRAERVAGNVCDQDWSEFVSKIKEAWSEKLKRWQQGN